MPPPWTEYEHIIVLYFASRKASHEACAEILHLKSAGQTTVTRSMIAVRCKLERSKGIPGLWDGTEWNTFAVDSWLMQQSNYVRDIQAAISVGSEELAILERVNTLLSPRKCCHRGLTH